MREVLFRAKRIDNGEWIYGYYAVIGERHVIIRAQSEDYYSVGESVKKSHGNEVIEIMPETVCQYTGYTDLRKKKVFEHDIVFYENGGCHGCIVFRNGCFSIEWESSRPDLRSDIHFWFTERRMYVIGSIFDDPELIN